MIIQLSIEKKFLKKSSKINIFLLQNDNSLIFFILRINYKFKIFFNVIYKIKIN